MSKTNWSAQLLCSCSSHPSTLWRREGREATAVSPQKVYWRHLHSTLQSRRPSLSRSEGASQVLDRSLSQLSIDTVCMRLTLRAQKKTPDA